MFGEGPPSHLKPVLDGIQDFIERVARPIEERHRDILRDERHHLEPDGRLTRALHEARMEVRYEAGRAGYYALHLPESIGGGGLSLRDMLFVQEAVYRHGLGLIKEMLAWTDGPNPMLIHLTPEARERFLRPLMLGEQSLCFACTEPEVGSDFTRMRTRAERRDGGWVLNGHKAFITNAPFADVALVIAVTGERDGRRELTAFLVPSDAPGYRVGRINAMLIEDGGTGELHFDDVWVPDEQVIGGVGEGFNMATVWINWARTRRGGQCAGLGRYLFERSLAFAQQRHAFNRPIGSNQAVQWLLVDIYREIYSARAVSLSCLQVADEAGIFLRQPDRSVQRHISLMKMVCDEALYRAADSAVQIHGARGLAKEEGIEKIFRVARNLRIPAGTTEMQRLTIAKSFGL